MTSSLKKLDMENHIKDRQKDGKIIHLPLKKEINRMLKTFCSLRIYFRL